MFKYKKREKERQLVAKLIVGDKGAFEEVVKQYHGIMLSVSSAIAGKSIAEEIVQDAWLHIIKGLPEFRQESSLKTWMLVIVSNLAKTRIKREKRYVRFPEYDEQLTLSGNMKEDMNLRTDNTNIQWHLSTPEEICSSKDLMNVIGRALDSLSPLQKSVLTLRDMHDVKTKEVSDILSLSETNVRVLLHRARSKLNSEINEYQKGLRELTNIPIESIGDIYQTNFI